jgi:hypothetical protein
MKVAEASKKILGASVLALSLSVLPIALPAAAQTDTNRPTLDTTPFQETRDDNNNWGWLGLIGLIGLANLFRKPRSRTVYQDPNVTTRTGYRD